MSKENQEFYKKAVASLKEKGKTEYGNQYSNTNNKEEPSQNRQANNTSTNNTEESTKSDSSSETQQSQSIWRSSNNIRRVNITKRMNPTIHRIIEHEEPPKTFTSRAPTYEEQQDRDGK